MTDQVANFLGLAAAALWLIVLLLPWRPWSTRERTEADNGSASGDLSDITVLIPARNEASLLPETLAAILTQGTGIRTIVVDDCSDDGTAAVVRGMNRDRIRLVRGKPLPDSWAGKLWALEQGLAEVTTSYTLLLDADITLHPGIVPVLRDRMHREGLHMVSVMARLPTQTFWERLLLPPYVYFFKLLYPFHLANTQASRVAAAAGGCILVETRVLRDTGAFAAWRDAIIDDCVLAKELKTAGYAIWIGLSRSVVSNRRHAKLSQLWNMVARTAYTQLRYSPALLLLATTFLALAFGVPWFLAVTGENRWIGIAGLGAMAATFLPTLHFYRLSPLWVLGLPVAALLYLAMTWTSAFRYWRGIRSQWKGRTYRGTHP